MLVSLSSATTLTSGIVGVLWPDKSSTAFWGRLSRSRPSAADSQSSSSGHSATARVPSDSPTAIACRASAVMSHHICRKPRASPSLASSTHPWPGVNICLSTPSYSSVPLPCPRLQESRW